MKMKIMVVGGGFLPAKNYGGPVVSIENLVNLVNDVEYWIVTRDHDWKDSSKLEGIKDGWNSYNSYTKVLYLSDEEHTVRKYHAIIDEVQPHVIYINGFYLAQMFVPMICAARRTRKPILIAPRGTLNRNAMSIKSIKKNAYVRFMRLLLCGSNTYFQSTSDEETDRIASLMGTNRGRIFTLENVPSIPTKQLVHPLKKEGYLKCCFFARICEKKNLLGAIRILRDVKQNVVFNIYGNIEENLYWKKCEEESKNLPENVHINYVGEYDHSRVFELMSQNDIFFFPTLSENYGHVIVEAMQSGLPVVISDQTPWNDINDFKCGYAIPLSNEHEFADAIEKYARMNMQEIEDERVRLHTYIDQKLKLQELHKRYYEMFFLVAGRSKETTNENSI